MTSFSTLSVVVPVPAGHWIHAATVFRIAPARTYVPYLIRRAVTATMGLAADLIGFQFLPAPSTPRVRVRARTVQDPFCWQAVAQWHQVRPVTIRAEAGQIAGAAFGTLDAMTNTQHE